jgi:hypothetical protein
MAVVSVRSGPAFGRLLPVTELPVRPSPACRHRPLSEIRTAIHSNRWLGSSRCIQNERCLFLPTHGNHSFANIRNMWRAALTLAFRRVRACSSEIPGAQIANIWAASEALMRPIPTSPSTLALVSRNQRLRKLRGGGVLRGRLVTATAGKGS